VREGFFADEVSEDQGGGRWGTSRARGERARWGPGRDPSGKLAGSFREPSGILPGSWRDGSGTSGRRKRRQTAPAARARAGRRAPWRLENRRSVTGARGFRGERARWATLPGSFRDPSGKLPGSWREAGGTVRGRFGDDSRTVRGRFEDGSRTLGRRKRGQTRPAARARGASRQIGGWKTAAPLRERVDFVASASGGDGGRKPSAGTAFYPEFPPTRFPRRRKMKEPRTTDALTGPDGSEAGPVGGAKGPTRSALPRHLVRGRPAR
jgi:hypothetical protein